MDFVLNDEQAELQSAFRTFCDGRFDIDTIRRLDAEGSSVDPDLWGELAGMGVFGLRVAESEGGVGLSVAEAVLVFEEIGRAIVPGPVLWTHLAAGFVPGAVDGSAVVGGIDLGDCAGGPILLEHPDALDCVLVLDDTGVRLVDGEDLDSAPVAVPLDPLTPIGLVTHLPAGDELGGAEMARRLRREGAAFVAAMQLGIAESATDQAVSYAKEREQFGRPIGSFQAVKHICADMLVRVEVARAAVYAAGVTFDDPTLGNLERAVDAATVCATAAAHANTKANIQVHGGMGYTWEVPAHYYLKRAWVLETTFGTADQAADRVACDVGGDTST
ncbi:MAG: acyl-CoA dehydrogenase [Actinobacteria bacterium ATB1]|nr:acyl-CoA dehydrogenase [Actinobacteria bacterium ATB1]